MAIVHYQLDDGVGANVKIRLSSCFAKVLKSPGTSAIGYHSALRTPFLQTALRTGESVTDTAALLATLFGDSGRIDTQAICASKRRYSIYAAGPYGTFPHGASDISDPLPVYMRHLAIC